MTRSDMFKSHISRRDVLGVGLGATAASALPALQPAAFAAQTGTPASPAAGTPVAGDGYFPGKVEGVPDVYTVYPEPYKTVTETPGNGGSIRVFKATQQPPPTPKEDNPYWQELDERLGVTTDVVLTPLDSYAERVATLFASGDLPDIMLLWFGLAPSIYEFIDQGAFTDLTPYLSGDALQEYPNLSKYPRYAWENGKIDGKIYTVPRMNFIYGENVLVYRHDWMEKLGISEPASPTDVADMLVAMSTEDPDGNGSDDTWGLGSAWGMSFITGMFLVPNNWRLNDDGSLTKDIETEEFREAIAYARDLYERGAYHPDVASLSGSQRHDEQIAGRVGGQVTAPILMYEGQELQRRTAENFPEAKYRVLLPPGVDGGSGVTHTRSGIVYANGIPSPAGQDEERVRELLRILDYYGALFGSEEYTFLHYGQEGRHHTLDENGSPVITEAGRAEVNELGNVGFPPRVFYYPTTPEEDSLYLQDKIRQILDIGIEDPTALFHSPTEVSTEVELDQLNSDRTTAIITGRESIDALDQWIEDWKSRGGDTIRQEYEEQINS